MMSHEANNSYKRFTLDAPMSAFQEYFHLLSISTYINWDSEKLNGMIPQPGRTFKLMNLKYSTLLPYHVEKSLI